MICPWGWLHKVIYLVLSLSISPDFLLIFVSSVTSCKNIRDNSNIIDHTQTRFRLIRYLIDTNTVQLTWLLSGVKFPFTKNWITGPSNKFSYGLRKIIQEQLFNLLEKFLNKFHQKHIIQHPLIIIKNALTWKTTEHFW